MKRLLTVFAAILIFSLLSSSVNAQRWLSAKGFWVVESNTHNPKVCTVCFYNNDKQLVYKEHISGRRLNIRRRRTLKHLEGVLDQAVTAWEKDHLVREDQEWVAGSWRHGAGSKK